MLPRLLPAIQIPKAWDDRQSIQSCALHQIIDHHGYTREITGVLQNQQNSEKCRHIRQYGSYGNIQAGSQ